MLAHCLAKESPYRCRWTATRVEPGSTVLPDDPELFIAGNQLLQHTGFNQINVIWFTFRWTEVVLTNCIWLEEHLIPWWNVGLTHHVGPHGGHFSSNAERKEASHPVSREYVRIQSVMEADVRELDIQCLPTTPTPHFCALIGSLFHVLTHH